MKTDEERTEEECWAYLGAWMREEFPAEYVRMVKLCEVICGVQPGIEPEPEPDAQLEQRAEGVA